MNDTAPRIKILFDEALDLDADARRGWLDALRVNEPEVAARVERLLALDAERADPFGSAIDSLKQTLDFDPAAWIDRELGGFRLLRVLGEGGMGAVYLAERQMRDFQQLVALKLLRGRWLERSALDRFAEERRILARLHHPNIATLIDAGATDDGRPFLVMEYIDGVPLLEYCDGERLGIPARLRLVRGLLAALAHAHGALIVHRDLKPGNVLVTPDGLPKLLDFGIARLIEADAAVRATATRAFTPDYASPEQLAGEPVGTASDIYSIGLILYELCVGVLPWDSGTRPFSGAAPTVPSLRFRQLDAEQCADLAARRGSDPQHLVRGLRGDLGRVLARCLDPDPAQRYATVHALDADLGALLARRPPPGVQVPRRERVFAFARRHAWPLAAAALVVAAGSALLVQSLLAEHRLAAERDLALASAESARVEAAKSAQIAGFVQSMLSGIDPGRAQGMDRSLLRLILDAAGERAGRELDGQPAVRVAIEQTIAESYNRIGEYELAIKHYGAAFDAADTPAERVSMLLRKARATGNLGHVPEATALAREALALAASLPTDSRERMFAESTTAAFECDTGQFQACHDGYTRVLATQRRVLGESDPNTLESMYGLAIANSNLGHHAEAEALLKRLIDRYRAQSPTPGANVFAAITSLANNYMDQARYAEAEALLKPALGQVEQIFGADHPGTLAMTLNLGTAISKQPGRLAEARPYLERALSSALSLYGEDGSTTVFAESGLAALLRDAGELDAAEQHARAAVEHMDRALGADSPYRGAFLDTLATILIAKHQYAEAERTLDRAYTILSDAAGFGPNHSRTQTAIGHYVDLYTAWKRPAKAAEWQARLTEAGAGAAP